MTARRRVTALSVAVLSLSLAASVLVLREIDRARPDATLEEFLFIPSPKVVKKLSFGYQGLVADIYWTRAVQYFGGHHHVYAKQYKLLYPLLDITTTLDPQLSAAYQFGSVFLCQKPPEGAGEPGKAVEIVERGIAANPGDWRLYYNLGFIYYDQKNYVGASKAFGRGSQVPGANPYLKVLAASTADHGGSPETARLIWTELYETSADENLRRGALRHLIAMQIDEDVQHLAKLVNEYAERTGHLPSNFREMVAAGWLKSVPRDPTGDPYNLLADGRVEIVSPKSKPFVQYGLPGGPQGPEPAGAETNK